MKNTNALAAMIVIVTLIVYIPLTMVVNGWALSVLWGWFVVPIFNLPALSIPYAIGISSTVGYMTYQYNKSPKDSGDEWY